MLFKEYKVEEFLEELSGDAPSPGGGSTAALVAALAGALNSMVYSLTVGKKCYESLTEDDKRKMDEFISEAKDFIKETTEFMEKDRSDFMELMDSYKLPKSTEEEKDIRKNVIFEKTKNAMNTPLKLCKEAIKFYDNIEFAVAKGNKNLLSDAAVAAILLNGAIESGVVNVKVNLGFIKDDIDYKVIENECKEILLKSTERKDSIIKNVGNIVF